MMRKATPQDAQAIAQLTYLIWHDMELEIVRRYSKERVINALMKSVTETRYRNHFRHVEVYEIDGQVAGMLVAYPGRYEAMYEQAWHELTLEDEIVLQQGTPLPLLEAEPEDFYIESIATFPQFRRRGVATQLIQHQLQKFPTMTWSLNCDAHNTAAYQLYRKLGFQEVAKKTLYGHQYRYMRYRNGEK